MSFTLAIGSRRRLAPASKATCNDSARFSTGNDVPAQAHAAQDHHLLLDRLAEDAEQRATNAARVMAVVGPVLCSSTTCRW